MIFFGFLSFFPAAAAAAVMIDYFDLRRRRNETRLYPRSFLGSLLGFNPRVVDLPYVPSIIVIRCRMAGSIKKKTMRSRFDNQLTTARSSTQHILR